MMGGGQSKDKLHCNRYLHGHGPPSLQQQAEGRGKRSGKEPLLGNQPEGEMNWTLQRRSLPGNLKYDIIKISFVFPDGIQTDGHPAPGERFSGLTADAFLPQSAEGARVLPLLERAFQQKLLFTVGSSPLGGGAVRHTDIPLKTRDDTAGPRSVCYPDPNYLKKVRKVLKSKGIE
ncbi:E3 ubiquitin-protein ligase DTX3L1 [Denticeps clupeoides]|uniref:E3 ubiquitin-protein ligase DTX3L1 n=1 Tax=Denticeps clupeoides TaxID=299321 RepID=UPI0010A4577C|nr:E3 ubiquitin-protein ligase DTX3L-like [Denticeps clupeoides]